MAAYKTCLLCVIVIYLLPSNNCRYVGSFCHSQAKSIWHQRNYIVLATDITHVIEQTQYHGWQASQLYRYMWGPLSPINDLAEIVNPIIEYNKRTSRMSSYLNFDASTAFHQCEKYSTSSVEINHFTDDTGKQKSDIHHQQHETSLYKFIFECKCINDTFELFLFGLHQNVSFVIRKSQSELLTQRIRNGMKYFLNNDLVLQLGVILDGFVANNCSFWGWESERESEYIFANEYFKKVNVEQHIY